MNRKCFVLGLFLFGLPAYAGEESHWNGWEESKGKSSSLSMVQYVYNISFSSPDAAFWFLTTGGKYGFSRRKATPDECELMTRSMMQIAITEKEGNKRDPYSSYLKFSKNQPPDNAIQYHLQKLTDIYLSVKQAVQRSGSLSFLRPLENKSEIKKIDSSQQRQGINSLSDEEIARKESLYKDLVKKNEDISKKEQVLSEKNKKLEDQLALITKEKDDLKSRVNLNSQPTKMSAQKKIDILSNKPLFSYGKTIVTMRNGTEVRFHYSYITQVGESNPSYLTLDTPNEKEISSRYEICYKDIYLSLLTPSYDFFIALEKMSPIVSVNSNISSMNFD